MASNYVQLNWLEPTWDDDQVGTLSSLERRQRKAAERQDINAFYSTLGFLFVVIFMLLVWSEFSAEVSLTVSFVYELWNSAKLVYYQLRAFYEYAKEVGLTCLAVVYGPDYQQRGVTEIAHGAARLLARGLYYLAVLLSGLLMCSMYPHVAHAPMRTAFLTTVAAGLLFGAPPFYALVVSRLCQQCNPQAVVLLAFLLAAVMCLATYRMGRGISRQLYARKAHQQHGPAAKQRSQPVFSHRRQASGGAAAGTGSSVTGAAAGAGGSTPFAPGLKDGAGGGGVPAAVQKRGGSGAAASGRTLSRSSSSSVRSAGAGAAAANDGAAAAAPDPTRPVIGTGRSVSSSSFSGSGSYPSAAAGMATATGGGNGALDPTRPVSRASGGVHNASSSSSLDRCWTSGPAQPKPGSQGQLSSAAGSRPGSTQSTSTLPHDPAGCSKPGGASGAAAARGGGSGSAGNASVSAVHSTTGGTGTSSALKNTSAINASKQVQQRHGAGGSSAENGTGNKAGKAPGSATNAFAPPSCLPPPVDPVAAGVSSGSGVAGVIANKHQQTTATVNASAKNPAAADPLAAPAVKKRGAAGSGIALPAAATLRPAAANPASTNPAAAATGKSRADSGGGLKSGVTAIVAPAPAGPVAMAAGQGKSPASAAPVPSMAPTTPATTGGVGAGGLLSRLTSTVAPALTSRVTKKAVTSLRKPGIPAAAPPQPSSSPAPGPQQQSQQQQLTQQALPLAIQPHPQPVSSPQYSIVPPPPPPPPRKSPAAQQQPPAPGPETQPTRNPWLNPNPVIKLAAGVAKGPKGSAAGRATTHITAAAATTNATMTAAADTLPPLGSRSGGGALPCIAAPQPLAAARSASCGGGVVPAVAGDSPRLSTRSSGATTAAGALPSSPFSSSPSANTDPVALPPPLGSPVCAAVGEPLLGAAPGGGLAVGIPAMSPGLLPTHAQPHLSLHPFQQHADQLRAVHQPLSSNGGTGEHLVSATIVTTDPGIGPLVAHKHASGDLDISSVAADYRPYSSYSSAHLPPGTAVAAVVRTAAIAGDVDSDSFSFFSTPPPVISDPSAAAMDPASASAANVLRDAEGPALPGAPAMMYSVYGGAGAGKTFASLSSFAADPVWSPNVPVPAGIFPPTATGLGAGSGGAAARGPRVPPPGFPSHAYGGAFAPGPLPTGGWPHAHPTQHATPAIAQPTAPAAMAAPAVRGGGRGGPADALPLPPAGDRGSLASLGFVEDGADSGSVGGGDDGAAGSCTICWSAPRQVGFLHGKTSHLCVCRRCAAQLREGVHRCPMCRQLIERIIDIF